MIDGMYARDNPRRRPWRGGLFRRTGPSPDAIFVGNDHMAFAVMDALRFDLGLRGRRMSRVVGYDDVPMGPPGPPMT